LIQLSYSLEVHPHHNAATKDHQDNTMRSPSHNIAGSRTYLGPHSLQASHVPRAGYTWSSKQQVVVALSFCEAEYFACSHCVCQIIWLHSLFAELGFPQLNPMPLYCDNQGTVTCTHDPQAHSRMKHIDIRAHFIHDSVNQRLINVHHIPRTKNPADLLTKPLHWTTHQKWLIRISLHQDLPKDYSSIPTGRGSQGGVGPDHRPPSIDTTLPLWDPQLFYISSFLYCAYICIYLYEP
jgi:hypothetical protein